MVVLSDVVVGCVNELEGANLRSSVSPRSLEKRSHRTSSGPISFAVLIFTASTVTEIFIFVNVEIDFAQSDHLAIEAFAFCLKICDGMKSFSAFGTIDISNHADQTKS